MIKKKRDVSLPKQRFDAYDMIDFAQQYAEEYARIQIEKDRENIKEAIFATEYEKHLINSLPIELD